MTPFLSKKDIRKDIRSKISEMPPVEKIKASLSVTAQIESLSEFDNARHIMLYSSLPDELSTSIMIERWIDIKNLYLPKIVDDNIVVSPLNIDSKLSKGKFNIEEPETCHITDLDILDIIIVPGRAFDKEGNRIGRGGGYYDKFLRDILHRNPDIHTIGVGYKCQLYKTLSDIIQPHDIKLKATITD